MEVSHAHFLTFARFRTVKKYSEQKANMTNRNSGGSGFTYNSGYTSDPSRNSARIKMEILMNRPRTYLIPVGMTLADGILWLVASTALFCFFFITYRINNSIDNPQNNTAAEI